MNPALTTEILAALGAASARASVLCVLVVLLVTLLGHKLAPQWRCVLWFLVFLRLAWPFHISCPFSIFAAFENLREMLVGGLGSLGSGPEFHPFAAGAGSPLVSSVWRIVAAIFLLRLFAGCIWNLWRLRGARPLLSWEGWWLCQQSKTAVGLHGAIAIYESPVVPSPCLVGFFRPRIVIPTGLLDKLSSDEVRLVFLHELAHLKRGDILVGWIFEGLRCLHWFNPAVWYACQRFHADREEACDAAALTANPGCNRTYGRLLLRFLSGTSDGLELLNKAALTEGAETPPDDLMHRIRAIARFRPGGQSKLLGPTVALIVFCVGFTEPRISSEMCSCPIHEAAACGHR